MGIGTYIASGSGPSVSYSGVGAGPSLGQQIAGYFTNPLSSTLGALGVDPNFGYAPPQQAYGGLVGTALPAGAFGVVGGQSSNSWLTAILNAVGGITAGIAGAQGRVPSKTTRALASIPEIGGIASGISSLFDSKSKQPFNVFAPLQLATDQLRRGIPFSDPRVQARLQAFDERVRTRFGPHLVAAGFPATTTAAELLSRYDVKGIGGAVQLLPAGTVIPLADRVRLGVPGAAQLLALKQASTGVAPAATSTSGLTQQQQALVALLLLAKRAQAAGYA